MTTILITGRNSQLCQELLPILTKQYSIAAFDSHQLDITDYSAVCRIVNQVQPAWIINCAAYTRVDDCETNRAKAFAVNASGPEYIARAANDIGARLIHISTDYVFDGTKTLPEGYIESDPVHPLSCYGLSKAEGENRIRSHCPDHLILRTAWLYSIHGSNFLKTILRIVKENPGRPITVVNDQFGSPTWAHSLARQIARLLDSGLTGTFHATAQGYCSWYELAVFFMEQFTLPFSISPCTTAEYPTAAARPANSYLLPWRLKAESLYIMQPWQEDVMIYAKKLADIPLNDPQGRMP